MCVCVLQANVGSSSERNIVHEVCVHERHIHLRDAFLLWVLVFFFSDTTKYVLCKYLALFFCCCVGEKKTQVIMSVVL